MRGKIAKQLRRFAEKDFPTDKWEVYEYRRTSHHSPNPTCFLSEESGKGYYKTLKKIWKMI